MLDHCLINIHNFDYPDSRLSGLFTQVPPNPDNRGSTVPVFYQSPKLITKPHFSTREKNGQAGSNDKDDFIVLERQAKDKLNSDGLNLHVPCLADFLVFTTTSIHCPLSFSEKSARQG